MPAGKGQAKASAKGKSGPETITIGVVRDRGHFAGVGTEKMSVEVERDEKGRFTTQAIQHVIDSAVPKFATAREAEEWIASDWNRATGTKPQIDVRGADVQACNASANAMSELGKLYSGHDAWKNFRVETSELGHPDRGRGPYAGGSARLIVANSRWFGDSDVLLRALAEDAKPQRYAGGMKGWHPKNCDTIESLIHHEFGHALHSELRLDKNLGTALSGLIDDAGFKEASVYAYRGEREAFAETFAEMLGTSRADWPARCERLADFLSENGIVDRSALEDRSASVSWKRVKPRDKPRKLKLEFKEEGE